MANPGTLKPPVANGAPLNTVSAPVVGLML
jgi:hypothetical protein